jgi:hypothetical protein
MGSRNKLEGSRLMKRTGMEEVLDEEFGWMTLQIYGKWSP